MVACPVGGRQRAICSRGVGRVVHSRGAAGRQRSRAELEAVARDDGPEALHARLKALDPQAAAGIDYQNVRRVIRALEVCLIMGRPISEMQTKQPPPFSVVRLGVTRPRPELYPRINAHVDWMIEAGLVAEVQRLVDAGYGWELPAMSGLGYRQIGQYLRGEIGFEEAVELIKRRTRRFVQQQYNWFSLNDSEIMWVNPAETPFDEIAAHVTRLIGV